MAGVAHARGTDGGVQVRYGLDGTVPPKVCVGTDSVITARVVREVTAVVTNSATRVAGGITTNMPDVVIDASVPNGSIIELLDTTRVTWLDGSRDPPTARFRFHANKAGTATVQLHARIADMADFGWRGTLEDRTNELTIEVIHCTFDISVLSRFKVEGEANLAFAAGIARASLTPSDDGEYRQSVTVTWFASVSGVGDCFGQAGARSSEANIFGTLSSAGVLTVDVQYEPFAFTLGSNCGGLALDVTASTLHFEVPPQGSGGILDQELTSPVGNAPGAGAFVVRPTDGPEGP